MRAIGLSFQKGRMRATVLDLTDGKVAHHASRAIAVDPDLAIPDLMERYGAQIKAVITEFSPNIIAVRQVWNSKNMTAAMCQVAPQGIAAYVCRERGVNFSAYTPQAIRQPKPFGLPKG